MGQQESPPRRYLTNRRMSEVPFTQVFPYDYGGAGDLNSNVESEALAAL